MDNQISSGGVLTGNMPVGVPQADNIPVKKKKTGLVIGIVVGVCVVAGGGVALAMILNNGGAEKVEEEVELTSADYGEAYRVIKERRRDLNNFFLGDFSCGEIEHRYGSSRDDVREQYIGYVNECLEIAKSQDSVFESIDGMRAIKYDSELQEKYRTLREATAEIFADYDAIETSRLLYNAWDEFKYRSELPVATATDEQIDNAVRPLLESGNETLANYGAGWAELTKAWVHAEQAYQASRDNDRRSLNDKVKETRAALQAWGKENEIDITELAGEYFSPDDMEKARNIYRELEELIATRYEEKYDDSGDCYVYGNTVNCPLW